MTNWRDVRIRFDPDASAWGVGIDAEGGPVVAFGDTLAIAASRAENLTYAQARRTAADPVPEITPAEREFFQAEPGT